MKVLYDGTRFCHTDNCCPVAVLDEKTGMIKVHDPDKPARGSFTFTQEEWNALIKHGIPA